MALIKRYFIYYPLFWIGYLYFRLTSRTFYWSYLSMRALFCASNGRFNDRVHRLISKKYSAVNLRNHESILSNLSEPEIDEVVNSINRNGYHVFDFKLDKVVIEELVEFAHAMPVVPVPTPHGSQKLFQYKDSNLKVPKYYIQEKDIYESATICELLTDPILHSIAHKYLQCEPVQDLTALWWSKANEEVTGQSEAAQLYHFDMDRIKFLKFFFYLTDVDSNTGPHCFIKGSHKGLPKELRKDGRFSEELINTHYQLDLKKEITGEKGSIIAVDTRGLHKGKPLIEGERLLLQFEFSNSLFGASYNNITLHETRLSKKTINYINSQPFVYQRFKIKSK